MSHRAASPFRIPQALRDDYRTWSASGFAGRVDAALYEQLDPAVKEDPGRLLSLPGARAARSRRNVTVSAALSGRRVWIKRFRPDGFLDRVVYACRPGKAVYAWNAAMALEERGFCTPRPVIGLRGEGRFGGAEGIVVFEDIDDHVSLLDWLGPEPPEPVDREALMRALGDYLRRFHDCGFRHRDLRRGNILAARSAVGWSFCLLDNNRLRIQAPLTDIQRLREVEKLNLSSDLLPVFFSTYLPHRDSEALADVYRERVDYADRLESRPLGRLLRKAWYYSWELRAFGRGRRP